MKAQDRHAIAWMSDYVEFQIEYIVIKKNFVIVFDQVPASVWCQGVLYRPFIVIIWVGGYFRYLVVEV